MRRRRMTLLVAGLAAAGVNPVQAQELVVGSGSRLVLGSSTVSAGCRDLRVDGTLDIGSGRLLGARDVAASGTLLGGTGMLDLNGNLSAAPALQPQQGTVQVRDGCDRTESRVSGAHAFHRLAIQIANNHAIEWPVNLVQTVAADLALSGGVERLVLRSSLPGGVAFLALSAAASQSVFRVDAIDVGAPVSAQWIAPLEASAYDSIDRGNTPRFFGGEQAVPVPVNSLPFLLLLTAAFLMAGARRLNPSES